MREKIHVVLRPLMKKKNAKIKAIRANAQGTRPVAMTNTENAWKEWQLFPEKKR